MPKRPANFRLEQRIASTSHLRTEVAAWQNARNQTDHTISWRFTTQNARIKLRRLYPSTHE